MRLSHLHTRRLSRRLWLATHLLRAPRLRMRRIGAQLAASRWAIAATSPTPEITSALQSRVACHCSSFNLQASCRPCPRAARPSSAGLLSCEHPISPKRTPRYASINCTARIDSRACKPSRPHVFMATTVHHPPSTTQHPTHHPPRTTHHPPTNIHHHRHLSPSTTRRRLHASNSGGDLTPARIPRGRRPFGVDADESCACPSERTRTGGDYLEVPEESLGFAAFTHQHGGWSGYRDWSTCTTSHQRALQHRRGQIGRGPHDRIRCMSPTSRRAIEHPEGAGRGGRIGGGVEGGAGWGESWAGPSSPPTRPSLAPSSPPTTTPFTPPRPSTPSPTSCSLRSDSTHRPCAHIRAAAWPEERHERFWRTNGARIGYRSGQDGLTIGEAGRVPLGPESWAAGQPGASPDAEPRAAPSAKPSAYSA